MLDCLLMISSADLIANSHIMMAFAFAISIISLSYMAGEFMTMPSLKGFAKAELYELGVSAVIFVILLTLIIPGGPFDLVAAGFMPEVNSTGPELCPEWTAEYGPIAHSATGWYANKSSIAFGSANYFLGCKPDISNMRFFAEDTSWWDPSNLVPTGIFQGVVTPRLMKGYATLMLTQMFTGLLSGLSVSITIPAFKVLPTEIGFVPFIGVVPLNQAHTTIVDLLGTAFAAFTGQNMLLKFIEESALAVFLPLGLMFRAFPFTRKTGSTIIAVVVAAYFIYPISILINQQVWMMIVDPQGQPNCKEAAEICTTDIECCSYDCRAGVCAVPLTDFAEYRSVYSLCRDDDGIIDKAAKIDQTSAVLAEESDRRLEMYFSGSPDNVEPTKSEARLKNGLLTVAGQQLNAHASFATSLFYPMPGATVQSIFSEMEVLVSDASQYALLALLFTVFTVVISLTMLKDIAILIGGEPRVFGISKLV